MATAKTQRKRGLFEFVQAKKREGCPVCALPVEIRGELAKARTKKIPREGW